MCGFAGFVAWQERYRVDRATLQNMSARIAHRGPDGQGLYLNHEAHIQPACPQVGMVHRRLAILDPDPRADQPFSDGQGRWLVFNGEIYNFRALRAELKLLNPRYEWRTDCDTEVLLVAYDVWAEKCVEHLDGMFAFAIWDEPKHTLLLARDRMGQKPLYVAFPSNEHPIAAIAFASELSALTVLPWFDAAVRTDALRSYLRWGYITGEKTIHRSARKIAPATWWRFTDKRHEEHCYFSPNQAAPASTDPVQQTRELVCAAVGRQLVSDVPIGCFLSGGVDSSIIAAAMTRAAEGAQNVHTFSIGFDDPRYDESSYAQQVARHLGTTHRTFRVTPSAAEDLPRLAAVFGEPFGDSSALPMHYLSREVRQFVKVALSGDGGDELFGGYDRYRAMRLEPYLQHLPASLRAGIAGGWMRRLPGSDAKSVIVRARRFLQSVNQPAPARYASYLRLFSDMEIDQLLIEPVAPSPDEIATAFETLLAGRDPVQAALATDRMIYLPGDLLTKVDRASMIHALEVRSPFMDSDVVQFAAGLATPQLLKGGPKRMLREAFAPDLPSWMFNRRKMGFAVPIGDWLRGPLRSMLHDCLFAAGSFASLHFRTEAIRQMIAAHESGASDHSQRLYALFMLEGWWRTL